MCLRIQLVKANTVPKSIVQQIANSIKTFYYRRFSDAAATECDDGDV